MISALLSVGTSPFLTAPILWSLTSAPPGIRRPLLAHLERLARYAPGFLTPRRIIQSLAYLVGVGVVRQLNAWLNTFALNHWRLSSDRTRWRWSEEIAVVTGGSGGIGALIVDKLASRRIRVIILDVQPPTGTRMLHPTSYRSTVIPIESPLRCGCSAQPDAFRTVRYHQPSRRRRRCGLYPGCVWAPLDLDQ